MDEHQYDGETKGTHGCIIALAIFGGITLCLGILAFGACFFMGAF